MHFSSAAAAAALVASVSGHMVMNTPPTYLGAAGYGASPLVQVNPLNGDKFQFPCQLGSDAKGYATGFKSTSVKAGSTTPVKFTGSAVHGGGSCQFSVTYTWPPSSKEEDWHVIHSMIGGCPAEAVGNIPTAGSDGDGRPNGAQCPDDKSKECVRQFQIPIPEKMKNGKATFAWTWFNKIGNREMYMNCAPIEITGGVNDDSFVKTLPPIFTANIPGKCGTGNGVFGFPNPGNSVTNGEDVTPGSQGACPAPGKGGSGGSNGGSYPGGDSPAPAPSATDGGIFAPGPTPPAPASTLATAPAPPPPASASYPPAPEPSTPAPPSEPPSTPPTPPASYPPPGGNTSGDASGVSCPTDGAVFCISATQFGMCNFGKAIPQAVAAGTECKDGKIDAIKSRHRRHRRSHRSVFDFSI